MRVLTFIDSTVLNESSFQMKSVSRASSATPLENWLPNLLTFCRDPKPETRNPRPGTARWSSRVSFPGFVIKFAPHKALKLIARCKLTFDETPPCGTDYFKPRFFLNVLLSYGGGYSTTLKSWSHKQPQYITQPAENTIKKTVPFQASSGTHDLTVMVKPA